MFAGETIPVQYRCEERIMDQMIDIFGTQLRALPENPGYFTAMVNTTEAGALFLAQQFLDAIEIQEPAYLKEEMKKRLRNNLARL